MKMNELIIATRNKGKVKEFKNLLEDDQLQINSLNEFQDERFDVEETGETFAENARLKAEQISKILHSPVLADDSGLVVDALNGEPGIYSARYAGEPSNDILNRSEEHTSELQSRGHLVCHLLLEKKKT